MIAAVLLASMIGSWNCSDSQEPGVRFLWVFSSDKTGSKRELGARPLVTRFSYNVNGRYLFRYFSDGGKTRDLISLENGRLRILSAGYWHENVWAAIPDAGSVACTRRHGS